MRLVFALVLLVLAADARASGLSAGISPSMIVHSHVLAGSTFEAQIMVSKTVGPSGVPVSATASGTAGRWMQPVTDFELGPGETRRPVRLRFNVPADAQGEAEAEILFRFSPETGRSVMHQYAIPVRVRLNVTRERIESYRIQGVRADAESQQILLSVRNTGNVMAGPDEIEMEVLNKNREVLSATRLPVRESVPAYTTAEIGISYTGKLDEGTHLCRISHKDFEDEVHLEAWPKTLFGKILDLVRGLMQYA